MAKGEQRDGYALIVGFHLNREDDEARRAQFEIIFDVLEKAGSAAEYRNPFWPGMLMSKAQEFQAIFDTLPEAQKAMNFVKNEIAGKVPVRAAIGFGFILDLGLNGYGHPLVDGSAWWVARETVEALDFQ